MRELHFACIHSARYRSGGARFGGGGDRNVTLAGEQSGCGVKAHPSGARQIYLGPGVKIGEVVVRTRGSFERFLVGFELDEITGDKARREAQPPQDLYHEPRRVAA